MLGHEFSFRGSKKIFGQARDFPFENMGNDNLGLGATPSSVSTAKMRRNYYRSLQEATIILITGIFLQLLFVRMVLLCFLPRINGDTFRHSLQRGVFRKKSL